MVESFLENMIMTLVCSFIAFWAKSAYNAIKKWFESAPATPKSYTSPKALHRQFLVWLFTFTFSISGAWGLPMGILKIFLAILAGYAFLFTWGAFDAALAFYPENDPGDHEPPKDSPNDSGKNQIKSQ